MRNSSRKTFSWLAVSMFVGVLAAGSARAVPLLQLYIENVPYASLNPSVPSQRFNVWAIGNLNGPGGSGGREITELRLAAVYDDPGSTEVEIDITPIQIGGIGVGAYSGFIDPSISPAVQLNTPNPVKDGSTPLIGGTHHLPSHGEYGKGKVWQEFALGAFTLADSQLGDFVGTFPTPMALNTARIHAYDVTVTGANVHFDLYGQVTDSRGRVSYVFAPPGLHATIVTPSGRNAGVGPEEIATLSTNNGPEGTVPLPATLALLLIGALGLGISRRRSSAG